MDDGYVYLTFDEMVEHLAHDFEEMSPIVRIRALGYVSRMIEKPGVDASNALRVIASISDGIHMMINTKIDFSDLGEPETGPMTDAAFRIYEHMTQTMLSFVWCGYIEDQFIKPLMCALAVEVQHQHPSN